MSEHLQEEHYIPYLDGRLEAAERAALDRHLAACGDCRARLEELRALMGVLGEWQAVAPSPQFDAALRARLAAEPAAALPWYALRPAYALGLAAVLLLALGVYLWPPAPPAPPVAQLPPHGVTPPVQVPLTSRPAATTKANDALAGLDNTVLLENYELLKEFDVLFEPITPEEKKSL